MTQTNNTKEIISQIEQTADKIFNTFERNSYPCLATKQNECENPGLDFHVNRMLKTYLNFRKKLCLKSHNHTFNLLYDLLIKIAIIFHDIGKLNCFFQWEMVQESTLKKIPNKNDIIVQKIWSYHTGLSSLLTYYFMLYFKQNTQTLIPLIQNNEESRFLFENFDKILINAIICHHSSLRRLDQMNPFENYNLNKKYYLTLTRFYLKYLQKKLNYFMDQINVNLLNCKNLQVIQKETEKTEQIVVRLSQYLKDFSQKWLELIKKDFEKLNKEQLNDKTDKIITLFINNVINNTETYAPDQNKKLFFYTVHASSVLTNLDKWEARSSRSTSKSMRNIEFDLHLSNTGIKNDPLTLIKTYLDNNRKDSNLNDIRDTFSSLIYKKAQNADLNKIYTMTAPCGIGKTLAIFKFAFILREKFFKINGFYPKIIYSLPFISICDQIEDIFKQIFNCDSQTDVLTVHHFLADLEKSLEKTSNTNFKPISGDNENIPKKDVKDSFSYLNSYEIKNWYSEIIFTTNVKLFNTLLTYKKENLMRFHRLTNSIIIVDEYHSIPKKYHDLIRLLLIEFKDLFNCTFILATATTPALFFEKDPIIELMSENPNNASAPPKPDIFQEINRYKIRFHQNEMNINDFKIFCREILKENPNKSIMIVVNTRKLAREIYKFLKDLQSINTPHDSKNSLQSPSSTLVSQNCFNRTIYHLSGNMTPFHRRNVLNKITTILNNPDNKKNNHKNLVLVTTQLIEAGIDISFQKIIRDLGPLYSIVQVAGRCNRNWKIQAENEIPIIDVINIAGSHRHVYDIVDIEVTIDFFKNLCSSSQFNEFQLNKNQFNDNVIEVSEQEIRAVFNNYSIILNDRKNRNAGYQNLLELDFDYLTNNFKLIKQSYVSPIIIIPPPSEAPSSTINKIKDLVNALRNNSINYFPRKLYNFMIDVHQNSINQIEPISYPCNSDNTDTNKVFESFNLGKLKFYILDLNNPKAQNYYEKSSGLSF